MSNIQLRPGGPETEPNIVGREYAKQIMTIFIILARPLSNEDCACIYYKDRQFRVSDVTNKGSNI